MVSNVQVSDKLFSEIASAEQIERTTKALTANGMKAVVVENAEEAKKLFFELVPEGAEVFLGSSVTLETLGIQQEIDSSGRFDALRPKMFAMNRETQAREIRKLVGSPDYAAGSVHAITEDGQVLIASNTGSQLGAYSNNAGKVIWVVGAQKLVKDMNEGLKRINEYVVPLEEEHMQELYKISTNVSKLLIINKEVKPDRITVIIVKEKIGF